MPTIEELREQYEGMDEAFDVAPESAIDSTKLLTFDYGYSGQQGEVVVATDEFTAVCPWNGLPDFGTVTVTYVPDRSCIELKSLKYYLMSFRSVGIVQEHAANRMLNDLVEVCRPVRMQVALDYKPRGGLHTVVTVSYEQP